MTPSNEPPVTKKAKLSKAADETGKPATPRKKRGSKRKGLDTKPFPFLKLPAEIRNVVYTYALVSSWEDVRFASRTLAYRRVAVRQYYCNKLRSARRWKYNYQLSSQLLRTCRQISDEATPLVYSANRFYFKCLVTLHSFLWQHSSQRRHIRSITLEEWGTQSCAVSNAAFTMLVEAYSLENFRFQEGCLEARALKSVTPYACIKFYRATHVWLESVGARKKSKTAGLDILELPLVIEGKSPRRDDWDDTTLGQKNFRSEVAKMLEDADD